MKYADGKGEIQEINDEKERDNTAMYYTEDHYNQVQRKSKRRERLNRRLRDRDDYIHERPVKRPRSKNIRHYDEEGYYG